MIGTGGVGKTIPLAESPSRDFGSIIFKTGDASDHLSWRPNMIVESNKMKLLDNNGLLKVTLTFIYTKVGYTTSSVRLWIP